MGIKSIVVKPRNPMPSKGTIVNFKNVLKKLNAGDELNVITYGQLNEILLYAVERKYVSESLINIRSMNVGCVERNSYHICLKILLRK